MEKHTHTTDCCETNTAGFKLESELVKTTILTLLLVAIFELIAYFGFFSQIDGFASRYAYYLIFLVIAVVMNSALVWHVKAYNHNFSCTTGMMIGMTVGMTAGFSIGLLVGATNGMFIGSLAGMVVGMVVGAWVGNCCGIMGVMEGLMAGLMGGLMGAMTAVMMISDNLNAFIPIVMFCLLIIVYGIIVMIYREEISKHEKIEYEGYNSVLFIAVNIVLTLLITFIMVYGPKSFLFAGA